MKGLLIALSGPSGVGKGTIHCELLKRLPNLSISVSATTRAPRPGEADGKNYFFVTKEKFEEMISRGDLLEYAETVGNMYGTPKAAVIEKLEKGIDVLLEIDVKGVRQVKKAFPGCLTIFVLPPSLEVLECRLRGRNTETEAQLAGRLALAKEELKEAVRFDYRVVNDDIDAAVRSIIEIIELVKNKEA